MRNKKFLISFLILFLFIFSILSFFPSSKIHAKGIKIKKFYIGINFHTHFVGGCIKKKAKHFNFRVHYKYHPYKKSKELINLHIGKYETFVRGKKVKCLFIYNSAKPRFCWKFCWGNFWRWFWIIVWVLIFVLLWHRIRLPIGFIKYIARFILVRL